jgi:hypothetical protein
MIDPANGFEHCGGTGGERIVPGDAVACPGEPLIDGPVAEDLSGICGCVRRQRIEE